ncbi:Ankyrin-3 like protein [Argiope bruennichi]|uniref:Ankyrin-3 like protein n=1 Tax=Argiope bruennichi TaxID=94029 RepID=A0A8T0ENH1_ARGBR|nr:Ankyrin-3 like protein [Argiope bruennichi]
MEFPNLMHHCFKVFSDLNRVRKLLAGGLDPNHQTYGGTTPFHWACMNPAPNIEVVRCLIQAGADINLENHMGYTPLHFAVIQRKRLVVKEFIGQGALINAQNYLGMSALHFAVTDFALFGTPILDRTHLDIWIVKKLLKPQYIDCDLINSNGDTPLMLSVRDYHIESVVQLLRSKANPNICNKDFQTPLHVAFSHPPSDIEIELLICGANIYAVDRHGITPLDILMNFTLDDENEEWIHKPVVDRLAEDIYPDYFVEILYLVQKWNLCEILEMTICSRKRGKGTELTNIATLLSKIDIIHLISKHLIREDIFCLIVAFSNMRIPKSLQDVQERSYYFAFNLE